MTFDRLVESYQTVLSSDDFETLMGFAKALASHESERALGYHLGLLKERSNDDLYLYLRDTFSQRTAPSAVAFLVGRLDHETDDRVRAGCGSDHEHQLGVPPMLIKLPA